MKSEEENTKLRAARYTAIATQLPFTALAGYGLGYALDTWLETTWLRIALLFAAIIGAMTQLIYQVVKDAKSNK